MQSPSGSLFLRTLRSTASSLLRPAPTKRPLVSLFTQNNRRTMASAMGKRLEGKTIVVTGASSGIGKATALEFARTSPKNLKLVLTARRTDKLEEVAQEIKKEIGDGVQVHPVKLDISKPDQVRSFVSNLPKGYQEIDVLVNNAGMVKGVDKAGDIKEEDMNLMLVKLIGRMGFRYTWALRGVSRGSSRLFSRANSCLRYLLTFLPIYSGSTPTLPV